MSDGAELFALKDEMAPSPRLGEPFARAEIRHDHPAPLTFEPFAWSGHGPGASQIRDALAQSVAFVTAGVVS